MHFGRLRLCPQFGPALAGLIEREYIALVHDNGLWGHSNYQAWRAARVAGIPYVLSPRGMLEP